MHILYGLPYAGGQGILCSGGNGIQGETPRLAAIRCPSEGRPVDSSRKGTRGKYLEAIRRLLQRARAGNQRGKPNVPDSKVCCISASTAGVLYKSKPGYLYGPLASSIISSSVSRSLQTGGNPLRILGLARRNKQMGDYF